MIQLQARPNIDSWTKNLIRYLFFHLFTSTGDRLSVRILNALTSNSVVTTVEYPIDINVGFITVPVDELVDPLLKWTRPVNLTPGIAAASPDEMISNIGAFTIQYAAPALGATPSYITDTQVITIVKGGIGDATFTNENNINTSTLPGLPIGALPSGGAFLTWVPSGRLMQPKDWGWLLYFSFYAFAQYVEYFVNYLDGSDDVFIRNIPAGSSTTFWNRNWYIPTGIEQCNLDPNHLGVSDYTITVYTALGNTVLAQYNIKADNTQNYYPFNLYYRNSIGGWDHVALRGNKEWSTDAQRTEFDQPKSGAFNGTNNYLDVTIRPKWKGFTGWMGREHLTALNDLLLSKECAIFTGSEFLPVKCTTQTLKYFDTKESLHSTSIELETAGTFRTYPRQLDSLR